MENNEKNTNSSIEDMCDDLFKYLSQMNNKFREQNAILENKNHDISKKKEHLFNIIFGHTTPIGTLSFLQQLQEGEDYWSNVINEGFHFVDEKHKACHLVYKEWQEKVKQQLKSQLDVDNCTFMEYNSIKSEIRKLEENFVEINIEIEQSVEKSKTENEARKEECNGYLQLIESIEPLLEEIRREQDMLMSAISIARRDRLAMKSSKEEQQLERDIAMLEMKVKQLERLNSKK